VFMPVNWPDFDQQCLGEAIGEFRRRERRYGASGG
jgi:undecaprenyl pyrophosphate synthase